MKKRSLVLIPLFLLLSLQSNHTYAQSTEVGFTVILSGAIMFGPHVGYWFDNHQYVETSVLAAYEGEFVCPFAINGSYNYYLGNKKWQPKFGTQFSLLMAPKKNHDDKFPKYFPVISLLTGAHYHSTDLHQTAETQLWVGYLIKWKKVVPLGLEGKYGYKF